MYFQAAFGGTKVTRVREWRSEEGDRAYTEFPTGDQFYFDSAFVSQDVGRWATIHEFAHTWDFKAYANSVESYMNPPDVLALITTDRGAVSEYALSSNREDFAESWTGTFFNGSWSNISSGERGFDPRVQPSQFRQTFIKGLVVAHQIKVESLFVIPPTPINPFIGWNLQ